MQSPKGPAKAPARAMLRAAGYDDKDFAQPMVAVVNTWSTVTPCNMHLAELAEPVRAGVRAGGATPIDFNTIVVSDGITMGGEGMRASLISREVIADSIELAVRGHSLDAAIIMVGCDKTLPGRSDGVGADGYSRRDFLWRYNSARSLQRAGPFHSGCV